MFLIVRYIPLLYISYLEHVIVARNETECIVPNTGHALPTKFVYFDCLLPLWSYHLKFITIRECDRLKQCDYSHTYYSIHIAMSSCTVYESIKLKWNLGARVHCRASTHILCVSTYLTIAKFNVSLSLYLSCFVALWNSKPRQCLQCAPENVVVSLLKTF